MPIPPERWARVEEMFARAAELTHVERKVFLDSACAGDAELRREVESLLAFDEGSDGFIETPAYALAAEAFAEEESSDAQDGRRVGPYRIMREVGRGGMGVVYEAVRDDAEFRQRVALKLVKRGLDTEDILRRFRHERQILAALEHPNIARLLDGGTTEDGLPYLVMEYVEGRPITSYCDERKLSTEERLKLFLPVCDVVQFAHRNLVVHRDIKPSNVIVAEDKENGRATPKLLDFGIAKLLGAGAEGGDAHTVTQLGVMTPEYASPEQVRGQSVTTATDVYSLGVLLYELLTGQRPYRITSRRPEDVARAVCEQEPTRPSEVRSEPPAVAGGRRQGGRQKDEGGSKESPRLRLSAHPSAFPLHPSSTSPANASGSDLKSLKGDLDNIILMALRKEPERRYASVAQFAEDIRRHLEGLPVSARKDTFAYRASKFVRRHRAGVAVAVLALVGLLVGVLAVLWQAREARRERDRARTEAAKAERVSLFVQEMLGSADPTKRGRGVAVADVLDEAARRAVQELSGQPEVLAGVRRSLGRSYAGLGLFEQAEPHLRAALEEHRRLYGERHTETAWSMRALAFLLQLKGEYPAAEQLLREALAAHREASAGADTDIPETLYWLGITLLSKGDTQGAGAAYREALEEARQRLGGRHRLVAMSLNGIGLTREYQGDLAGAESLYRDSLEAFRRLPGGGKSLEMAAALNNLGTNQTTQGKYAEAEVAFREVLTQAQELLGESHALTANAYASLGRMYMLKGDHARAEEELRRALDIQRRALPPEHPDLPQALSLLGLTLTRAGRASEGEPYLRESLAIRRKTLPAGHWLTANIESALGECLLAQKRFIEAEPLLLSGHEGLKQKLGPTHPRTTEASQRIISLYESWGRPADAAPFREEN